MSHKYFYYIFFWINSLEELDTSLSTEQLRNIKDKVGSRPQAQCHGHGVHSTGTWILTVRKCHLMNTGDGDQ